MFKLLCCPAAPIQQHFCERSLQSSEINPWLPWSQMATPGFPTARQDTLVCRHFIRFKARNLGHRAWLHRKQESHFGMLSRNQQDFVAGPHHPHPMDSGVNQPFRMVNIYSDTGPSETWLFVTGQAEETANVTSQLSCALGLILLHPAWRNLNDKTSWQVDIWGMVRSLNPDNINMIIYYVAI